MQAVAAVGDVSDAQIFARRQKVFHADRKQASKRNLERPASDIDVVVAVGSVAAFTRAGVQVDAVAADTD